MKIILAILAAGIFLVALYWWVARPWYAHWGATAAELTMKLPGDDIAAGANMVSTRTVTVHAPAAKIYPWLVQLGQGRGGMYSYEWLENLARCDIHNVYQIIPTLQQVQAGQEIRMGPEGYPLYHIYSFEPGHSFVLRPADPVTKQPGPASWALVLNEGPDGTTRLIARQRQAVGPGFANFLTWRVIVDPMSFIMEQKMLRTIRDLAEQQM
jgi:hypothetical protein